MKSSLEPIFKVRRAGSDWLKYPIPEPFTNIVASIIEDIIAIVAIFIAVFAPLLALFLLVCALIVTALLLPRIIRVMKRSFARVRKLFTRGRAPAY